MIKPILPLIAVNESVDDTGITNRVNATLAADKGSSLTRVGIETTRGVVHLTGVVQSSLNRSRAEQVTRIVSGVRGVTNNLQVGP